MVGPRLVATSLFHFYNRYKVDVTHKNRSKTHLLQGTATWNQGHPGFIHAMEVLESGSPRLYPCSGSGHKRQKRSGPHNLFFFSLNLVQLDRPMVNEN